LIDIWTYVGFQEPGGIETQRKPDIHMLVSITSERWDIDWRKQTSVPTNKELYPFQERNGEIMSPNRFIYGIFREICTIIQDTKGNVNVQLIMPQLLWVLHVSVERSLEDKI
jgi:hypothetical protein